MRDTNSDNPGSLDRAVEVKGEAPKGTSWMLSCGDRATRRGKPPRKRSKRSAAKTAIFSESRRSANPPFFSHRRSRMRTVDHRFGCYAKQNKQIDLLWSKWLHFFRFADTRFLRIRCRTRRFATSAARIRADHRFHRRFHAPPATYDLARHSFRRRRRNLAHVGPISPCVSRRPYLTLARQSISQRWR